MYNVTMDNVPDVFSLYVLLSQSRSSDNTLESCFIQILSYSGAYVPWFMKSWRSKFPGDLHKENKPYTLKRSIVATGKGP